MFIIYIAHPIAGAIEKNLLSLRTIIHRLNILYPEMVPFVPYYADVVSMDDYIPEYRAKGLKNATTLIQVRGLLTGMWLFGDRISMGMEMEIHHAIGMNVPVYCHSLVLLQDYEDFLKKHYPNRINQLLNTTLVEL